MKTYKVENETFEAISRQEAVIQYVIQYCAANAKRPAKKFNAIYRDAREIILTNKN